MAKSLVTSSQVEELVNQGLKNSWYPVLPSWRLTTKPLGITRLSQNLVLWRDKNGSVNALEDPVSILQRLSPQVAFIPSLLA